MAAYRNVHVSGRVLLSSLILLVAAGCAEREPVRREPHGGPWRERTAGELSADLTTAKSRARAEDKRVLLAFISPRSVDSHDLVRAMRASPARDILAERYVPVYVNVREFDLHREIAASYQVRALATLVVVEPDGNRVASVTFERRRAAITPESVASWLERPADHPIPRRGEPEKAGVQRHRRSREPEPPLFPPEVHGEGR